MVRFWNVGEGPAILRDVRLEGGGQECLAPLDRHQPVAADQGADLYVRLLDPPSDDWGDPAEHGVLRIYYTSGSGENYMTTSRILTTPLGLVCLDYGQSSVDDDERDLRRSELQAGDQ